MRLFSWMLAAFFTIHLAGPGTAESVLIMTDTEIVGEAKHGVWEPAPGQLRGRQEVHEELSAGKAKWHYFVDHEGDEPVVDLRATFLFSTPPARITPGETIEIKLGGAMAGHSYGKSLRPGISIWVDQNFGIKVKDGHLSIYNGDLPLLKENTAAVISNAKHGGSVTRSQTAKITVSESARDGFKIIAGNGVQKIIWSYTLKESEDVATLQRPEDEFKNCPLSPEFERIHRAIASLERIKSKPELFSADVGFRNEPFEICIKDGKATLKGEPEAFERAAGMAATLLSLGVGARPTPKTMIEATVVGKLGLHVGTDVGKLTAAEIRRLAKQRAVNAGTRLSLQQIKSTGERAEMGGKLAKTALSKVFSEYEPKKISEGWIAKVIGGGHLEVSAAEGLEIYRDMTLVNEIARENAENYYCKLLGTQLDLMAAIRAAVKKASGAGGACEARLDAEFDKLKKSYRKLHHDLTSIGIGFLAEFGQNWTMKAVYRDLECAQEASRIAAKKPNLRR